MSKRLWTETRQVRAKNSTQKLSKTKAKLSHWKIQYILSTTTYTCICNAGQQATYKIYANVTVENSLTDHYYHPYCIIISE